MSEADGSSAAMTDTTKADVLISAQLDIMSRSTTGGVEDVEKIVNSAPTGTNANDVEATPH